VKCIITPSSRLLRACRLLGRLQKRLQGGYLNAMPRSIGRQNKTFGGCGPAALVPALGSGFGCPGAGRPRGLLCSGVRVRRGTTTGRVTRILRPFSWSAEPWKVGNGRRADGSQTHITGQKRHRLGARAACTTLLGRTNPEFHRDPTEPWYFRRRRATPTRGVCTCMPAPRRPPSSSNPSAS